MIDDFLLVDGGAFREAEFRALLAGARYPARSPDVNVADIKAQVAANEKGVQELQPRGRAVRLGDGARLHAARDGQRRGERAPRHRPRIGDGSFDYTMDDGSPLRVSRRAWIARRAARWSISPAPGRSSDRQLQRAAGGDARGGAVRVPLPGRRRHPAQRRLPQADPDS